MKLVNKTCYSGRDLRRFLLAGVRAAGCSERKAVEIGYSRGGVHGWANYGSAGCEGGMVKLTLPRDPAALWLDELARVFEHELAHNLGLKHGDMDPAIRYCHNPGGSGSPEWARGLTIGHRAAVKPAKRPAAEVREERARTRLAELEREIARKQRLLKKWRAKVSYYDRRMAAGGVGRRKKEECDGS